MTGFSDEVLRDRIALVPLTPDDAAGMFPGLADAAAYVFLPGDRPDSVEALRAVYARRAVGRSADGSELWFNWAVRRRTDHAFLGYVQATVRRSDALVAYHIFPRHWRLGYGTEALLSMLGILFERPGIEQAKALVDTRNVASLRLLNRVGFGIEGKIENADWFKGQTSHEYELTLSRSNWCRRLVPS